MIALAAATVIGIFGAAACDKAGSEPAPPDIKPPTRIYAALVSHNEEAPHVQCTPTVTDHNAYLANRALTLKLAQTVVEHGAAWDLQSDWQYLEAVRQWDNGAVTADSNGENLVAYLAALAPDRIVLDAHAHETQYNMADVAYLHQQLGAPVNGVVGGFLYYPFDQEKWTRFTQPLAGVVAPAFSHRFDILWGAATVQHVGPDSKVSGIWRPKSAELFHEDDPAGTLVNVGGYSGGEMGIETLLDKLHAGELEAGKMYTATIFLNQCTLDQTRIDALAAFFDSHAGDVAAGDLVWATLPEMVRQWRDLYDSAPVIFPADGFDPNQLGGADCASACTANQICCPAGLPCAGRCVVDCRSAANSCPPAAPTCDTATGLCSAAPTADVASAMLTVTNPTSGNGWWVKAIYPSDASATTRYPAILFVPGGSGAGSAMESIPDPSRNPSVMAAQGFVVVLFDADGRGNTPGTEDYCGNTHQDGLKAVFEAVAALPYVDTSRIGVSTNSYGITMGSGLLARYPNLAVRFLVDVEGPADRNDTGHCDADDTGHITHVACTDDAWWAEREAATFIKQVQLPYLRLQHVTDHAQPDNAHAILMINNATHVNHGGLGAASWTRVNRDGENAANTTFALATPPFYVPNTQNFDLPALWSEMFALTP